MAKKLMYRNHLKKAKDLVTSRDKTRAGFIALALEKNYVALPYIEEAKALKILAKKAKVPKGLLKIKELMPSLLTASGLSEKSLAYLTEDDKVIAIKGMIKEFLELAGKGFIDELVYRYLLTKGDALGGRARNLAGTLGEKKFLRSLLSVLNIYKQDYFWMDNDSYKWHPKPSNDADLEKKIKALFWERNSNQRIMVLNVNVPIVGKNIDISILESEYEELTIKGRGSKTSAHRNNRKYLALGELKGGIDPAGADEHWKTANSALGRIRSSFEGIKMNPKIFFVGAAIENSMADEIFGQLKKKVLHNAANLTVDEQLTSVCDWIIHL